MKRFITLLLCTLVLGGTAILTGCGKVQDNTVAKRIVKHDMRVLLDK